MNERHREGICIGRFAFLRLLFGTLMVFFLLHMSRIFTLYVWCDGVFLFFLFMIVFMPPLDVLFVCLFHNHNVVTNGMWNGRMKMVGGCGSCMSTYHV